MPSFIDGEGQKWSMRITVADLLRVQQNTGVLLTTLVDDGCKGLGALREDYKLLVDIIWSLVEPQAKERGISDEQFVRSLGGDAIYHAFVGLSEGLRDFFLESPDKKHIGQMVGAILDKAKEFMSYQGLRAQKALDEVKAMTPEQMESLSSKPVSDLPA